MLTSVLKIALSTVYIGCSGPEEGPAMRPSPPALSKSAKRRIAQQNTARNRKLTPLLLHLDLVIACYLFMLPSHQPDVDALSTCFGNHPSAIYCCLYHLLLLLLLLLMVLFIIK